MPKENINPLLILSKSNGYLETLGGISDFVVEDQPKPPEIVQDQSVAEISGLETDKFELGIGLKFLEKFLSFQFTRGRITDCNATVRVGFGTCGWALFQNQIIIVSLTSSPFSAGGDSGSLIVTDVGNRRVGLLFAGSGTHTVANHIGNVLSALNVTIVA